MSNENPRKPRFEIWYGVDETYHQLTTWRRARQIEQRFARQHPQPTVEWALVATVHRHFMDQLGSHEMAGAMVTCTGELLIIEADSVDHLFRVWNLVMTGVDSNDPEGVPEVPRGPIRLVGKSEPNNER